MTKQEDVLKILGLGSKQALHVRFKILEAHGIKLDEPTYVKSEKLRGRTRTFSDSDIQKLKNCPLNKGGRGHKTVKKV